MKKFSIKKLAEIIKSQVDTRCLILDTRTSPPTGDERFILRSSPRQVGAATENGRATSDDSFTGVSIDSRTIKAGDCFFAIVGENFDGHDFVSDAFAKGAVCAVVSKDVSSCVMRRAYSEQKEREHAIRNTQYAILKVNDTVKSLGEFAAEYRRQVGYKVVAITGSVGKTTTRQIAYHVLSQHFRVYQSPKNFNNNIGLPLTLLGADSEHQIVIVEFGTNHPGEIANLTRIAQPDVAVITNVSAAHLEGLGDLKTIAREKLSIAEGLRPGGVLIVNTDNVPRVMRDERRKTSDESSAHRIITLGKLESYDYRVRDITYNEFSSSFIINGTQIELPLPGAGNVENALAACAICCRFGLSIDDFAKAVKTVQSVSMRGELLRIGTLMVINDCYNANPASMKNALNILTNIDVAGGRRRVFICGDMAELGQQSQALHTELGVSIAKAGVQVLLTVGKFAKITTEAAKINADYNLQAECFGDTLSACNNLQKFIKDDDIILVKGSRAVGLELVIEKLKEIFS